MKKITIILICAFLSLLAQAAEVKLSSLEKDNYGQWFIPVELKDVYPGKYILHLVYAKDAKSPWIETRGNFLGEIKGNVLTGVPVPNWILKENCIFKVRLIRY